MPKTGKWFRSPLRSGLYLVGADMIRPHKHTPVQQRAADSRPSLSKKLFRQADGTFQNVKTF